MKSGYRLLAPLLTTNQVYNINGIVASADGRYLIVVQTRNGKLFQIELSTKAVQEINVSGGSLIHGDGLASKGTRLYVARNAGNTIATLTLSADFSQATITQTYTDSAFTFRFSIALAPHGHRPIGGDCATGQATKPA